MKVVTRTVYMSTGPTSSFKRAVAGMSAVGPRQNHESRQPCGAAKERSMSYHGASGSNGLVAAARHTAARRR